MSIKEEINLVKLRIQSLKLLQIEWISLMKALMRIIHKYKEILKHMQQQVSYLKDIATIQFKKILIRTLKI